VYDASNGAWVRASDFSNGTNVASYHVFVDGGIDNLHTGWVVQHDGTNPVIVGTDDISFNKFSSAGDIKAGDGLTKVGETLNITACNTNDEYNFLATVSIADTLDVTGATTLSSTLGVTGVTTLDSSVEATGDFSVNTDKFTVASASGNTKVAGTFNVTGATTLDSSVEATGDFSVATNKFIVLSATGNTEVAGTLGVTGVTTLDSSVEATGDFSVNTDKFTVASATGNTEVAGTLGVVGDISCNGTITATGDIIAFYSSDIALKTNLQKIENPLEKLKQINGYTYDWIEKPHIHSHSGRDTGVIAQEIETLEIPGIAITRQNGYMAVRYEKIIPLLIECIKAQQEQIDKQQKQIDLLLEK